MKSESAFRGLRRRKHKDAIIHHTNKAEGHFPTSSQGLILIWNKHSVIFLFFFFFYGEVNGVGGGEMREFVLNKK